MINNIWAELGCEKEVEKIVGRRRMEDSITAKCFEKDGVVILNLTEDECEKVVKGCPKEEVDCHGKMIPLGNTDIQVNVITIQIK